MLWTKLFDRYPYFDQQFRLLAIVGVSRVQYGTVRFRCDGEKFSIRWIEFVFRQLFKSSSFVVSLLHRNSQYTIFDVLVIEHMLEEGVPHPRSSRERQATSILVEN